jgi:surface-anchored protein
VFACFAAIGVARADTITNYMANHSDIAVSYDDGDWNVHYRFDGYTVLNGSPSPILRAAPETIHVIVPNYPDARFVLNSNQVTGAYAFIGTTAGHTNWIIPQTQPGSDVPFFGFGTDEVDYSKLNGAISFRLTSFSGPGNFSTWESDSFGNPVVHWTTANGIGDDDVVVFTMQTHAHHNFGFTEPGEYVVGVTVSAESTNNEVLTSTKNIVFEVAPFAVPSLTIQQNAPSNVVISLPTVPSQLYQLQSATNVAGPWSNVGAQFTGSGLTNQITRTNTPGQEFFRIQTPSPAQP